MGKKVLVLYHSQSGNTEKMAQAVREGALTVPGTEVNFRKAAFATVDDLVNCDAIAFGSPVYASYMSGAMKDVFDRTFRDWRGRGKGKPYAAFQSCSRGGRQALDAIDFVCTHFQLKKADDGIMTVGAPSEEVLAQCRNLGSKLASLPAE